MKKTYLCAVLLLSLSVQLKASSLPDIYVVQPKSSSLAKRWSTSLMGVTNLNSRFVWEVGLSLAGAYNFNEDFALELRGSWFFYRTNSSLFNEITELQTTGDTSKKAFALTNYLRAVWLFELVCKWSLLHGKVSFHNWKLGDFTVFLQAGLGLMELELANPNTKEANPILVGDKSSLPLRLTTPFGIGAHLVFAKDYSLNLSLTDNVQAVWTSPRVGGYDLGFYDVSHKLMFSAGVGYVF